MGCVENTGCNYPEGRATVWLLLASINQNIESNQSVFAARGARKTVKEVEKTVVPMKISRFGITR